MSDWTRDDVERWLNKYPLPATMTFRAEKVWPRYQLKKGYGFWLRTAGPYHPALRGLFALIVEIINAVPVGQAMPTPDQLAEKIREWETSQLDLPFTEEDNAAPEKTNPAEMDPSRMSPLERIGQHVPPPQKPTPPPLQPGIDF